MKRKFLSGILLILLSFGITGTLQAAPWYQPAGLSAGDTYQLAFVTSTTTDAVSAVMQDYFDFVNKAAGLNSDLSHINFRPIVSAPLDQARHIAYVWGPVFNLHGDLVADNLDDFWDGTIINPINITEQLNIIQSYVWTGTNSHGYASLNSEMGSKFGETVFGQSSLTTSEWIITWISDSAETFHVYGLSDPLTAVPIPATVWLLGTGILSLMAVRRKAV